MRRGATDAEALLWRLVRNRQVCGAKFRRQHQFGPYIIDFYCAELRLALEVDGGHHFEPDESAYDALRSDELAAAGVLVVRFTNVEVLAESEAVAGGGAARHYRRGGADY
ncbi:MAG: endonuclease domain-containing protein [Dehalococcoidia bacterium]|nr:endonuclease domain-containing protein [Dehalococcoidia bacterium]